MRWRGWGRSIRRTRSFPSSIRWASTPAPFTPTWSRWAPATCCSSTNGLLGETFVSLIATEAELPIQSAVAAYPFNSQLLTLPDGSMSIVAPAETREEPHARAFLQRVLESGGPVRSVHYLDLRQSMQNGGGPACLRQRIVLSDDDRAAIKARVLWDEALGEELEGWVRRHYRDRLVGSDLADPQLARDGFAALDELTQILRLGSVYDFQR